MALLSNYFNEQTFRNLFYNAFRHDTEFLVIHHLALHTKFPNVLVPCDWYIIERISKIQYYCVLD